MAKGRYSDLPYSKRFAIRFGGKIKNFSSLPKEAKYSIVIFDQYGYSHLKRLPKLNDSKIEAYGDAHPDLQIGIVKVPMTALVEAVEEQAKKVGYDNFEMYHEWYLDFGDTPFHETRWPPILGDTNNEVFEDGWHRFHSYYRAGDKTVTCIYYPDGINT